MVVEAQDFFASDSSNKKMESKYPCPIFLFLFFHTDNVYCLILFRRNLHRIAVEIIQRLLGPKLIDHQIAKGTC